MSPIPVEVPPIIQYLLLHLLEQNLHILTINQSSVICSRPASENLYLILFLLPGYPVILHILFYNTNLIFIFFFLTILSAIHYFTPDYSILFLFFPVSISILRTATYILSHFSWHRVCDCLLFVLYQNKHSTVHFDCREVTT